MTLTKRAQAMARHYRRVLIGALLLFMLAAGLGTPGGGRANPLDPGPAAACQ